MDSTRWQRTVLLGVLAGYAALSLLCLLPDAWAPGLGPEFRVALGPPGLLREGAMGLPFYLGASMVLATLLAVGLKLRDAEPFALVAAIATWIGTGGLGVLMSM